MKQRNLERNTTAKIMEILSWWSETIFHLSMSTRIQYFLKIFAAINVHLFIYLFIYYESPCLSRKYSIPGAWMSPLGRAVNQQGGIDRPSEEGTTLYHLLTLLHLPISKESKIPSLDSVTKLFALHTV
jgi:hypothetical protein